MNWIFLFMCIAFVIEIVQPLDRLNLNESSSDDEEGNEDDKDILQGILNGTNYVAIDSNKSSSKREQNPVNPSPNDRINLSQEQLAQTVRRSKGKSLTPNKYNIKLEKSPSNSSAHSLSSNKSLGDSLVLLSSPHKRKSNSPQNADISIEDVSSPKISKLAPRRYLSLISPKNDTAKTQIRRYERTQSTPPRYRTSSRTMSDPLEGTSKSTSQPAMLPVKDPPEVAEADSTTTVNLPIFPTERMANLLSQSSLSLSESKNKKDKKALRKYQEEKRALRRLQDMNELVTDNFITIDALDPMSDLNRQKLNNDTNDMINKTKNFKFSYELDGMCNYTYYNKTDAPNDRPDDNNDQNGHANGDEPNNRPQPPDPNPREDQNPNPNPQPGPNAEGPNPNQGGAPRSPDPADDPGSQICDDDMADLYNNDVYIERPVWHGYSFGTGTYNREELKIVEVVAEKSFNLDRQIIEWKSRNHHAVGRGDHGLTLITSYSNGIHIDNQIFDPPVSALDMFQWWDMKSHTMNIGILTVQSSFVNWHHLNNENKLTQLWSWSMTFPIIHVAIFNLDGNWKVAITHEQNGPYKRAISIYGLDLWENWWFEEKLRGYGEPIIINNGRLMAALLEDSETIMIYKYDYSLRRYTNFKNFTSPGVENVKAFVVGSHSFLAIGGDQPGIYEIKASQFEEKNVIHYKLQHVENWLPITLGYYRNDAIVLFQHKLDHYTHSSSILEALKWDGKDFHLLEHSPCKSHDEEMHGFSCILDAEGEKGIKGAASFKTLDDKTNILTASEEYTPIMFEIKTELIEIPDPIDEHLEQILAHKKYLEDKFSKQQKILKEADKIASYALNHNEDVIFADGWNVKEIVAPSIHIEGTLMGTLNEDGYVDVAGQDWRNIDSTMDITYMFDQIKTDHDRIKTMVNKLKSATMKKDGLPNEFKDVTVSGNIVIDGSVKVKKAHLDVLNGLNVDSVLENSVKKNKDGNLVISGKVIVDNFITNDLNVERINGINIMNEDKSSTDPIVIEGDLEIFNHVHVLKDVTLGEYGTVNNINFKTDVYSIENISRPENYEYPLSFDSVIVRDGLKVHTTVNGYDFTKKGFEKLFEESRQYDQSLLKDDLVLETVTVNNLNFDLINGRSWKDFIRRIVMKNEDLTLERLKVDGSIKVEENLKINALNNLAYPRDYFLLNDNTSSVFTALKTFENVLHVDEIDCEGVINGISPEDIVTLSTKQRLSNFTFFDLAVSENLNVQGNITGKELEEFLSNPHLTDVNEIKSNVIFKNLKVNGTVIVENKINGSNWNNLFKGVMMKTNQPLTVDSLKTFEGLVRVENDMNIRSGFLNNRRVTDFFTVDTDQILIGDTLMGDIGFEELEVNGMFDKVNVTHLNSEVITLDGNDQNIASDMIFEDDVDYSDYPDEMDIESRTFSFLDISELVVNKHCNDWAVPDDALFYNQESLEFSLPKFKNLYVDHLIIEGNLITDKPISGIDMYQFDRVRLSKTQSKNIIAPYTVNNCTIDSVDFVTFNGLQKYDIVNFKNKMDNVEDELINGGISIGTLHVKGNLNVTNINGIDLRFVADNAIWLKDDNYISGHLKFVDKIYVKSLQLLKNAHGVNFEKHMDNLVRVDDNVTVITGKKVYNNGLTVKGKLTTDFINDFPIGNIFTVHNYQDLKGNLRVIGKLSVVKNLQVDNLINDISMKGVADSFDYSKNNKYSLKGNFFLDNGAYVDDFIINGLLNNIYSMKDLIESTINPTSEKYFSNNVIFTKPVIFKNNLNIISTYNNIFIQKLLDDVVVIDAKTEINSSIIFVAPIIIKKDLNVENNMLCDIVQYCSITEWINNAIFLDEYSQISGIKSFEELVINGNVRAKYLNNILINDLVTLNTEQTLTKGLNFVNVNVKSDMLIDETVNLKNITNEFNNILTMKGNQVIESPMFFHSNVFVTDAFIDSVNGIKVDNIFNLDTDQFLKGKYSFRGKSIFQNNFNVTNLISNIDFNLWFKNAIFTNDFGNNIINGKWKVSGYTKFLNEINGPTSINGLKISDFENYIIQRNKTVISNENYFAAKYKYFNDYLANIKSISEKRIYLFKYLEEIQSLSSSDLSSVHYFVYKENNYILTHSKWECKSFLWKWKINKLQFEKVNHVSMGCPIKVYSLKLNDFFILMNINDKECECDSAGTTIWSFDGNTFQLVKSLDSVNSISIPPNNAGTFYTMNEETIDYYTIFPENGNFKIEKTMLYPKPSGNVKFLITNYEKFGTFVSDGEKLYEYSISDVSPETGKILKQKNKLLASADEIIEFVVGKNKKLTAVLWTTGVNNQTKGSIKIYQDVFNGIELQEISTTEPSSLTILQLDNLQTVLLYVERKNIIPVYLYHGIEGFKLLYNLDIPTNKIMNMKLKIDKNNSINGLMLCNDDVVSIIKIAMTSQFRF